jgi:predicted ATPase
LLKKVNMQKPPVTDGLLVGAESCFEQAVAIARQQEAKSFELRAIASLARLLHRQNRLAEARERLTRIYDWFAEGMDTPDLREARDLIRELT